MDAVESEYVDEIERVIAEAIAAEPGRMVHEGGGYYAERIIRRAIEQGTLSLARSNGWPTAEEIEHWMIDAHNEGGEIAVTYVPPEGRKLIAQHNPSDALTKDEVEAYVGTRR